MLYVTFIVMLTVIEATTVLPDDLVEDTQHAICKIMTQEIQTSANATVKRQLKGVCTTKQLEYQFKRLEDKLMAELGQLKALLTGERVTATVKTTDNYDYYDENLGLKNSGLDHEETDIVSVTEVVTQDSDWVRTEIHKLNDTIYSVRGKKVYSYYWEIPKITQILPKTGIHIRSPDMYVLGHQLCLQLYPNHLDSVYLGIQLRPSSNFLKKHKFTILDQFDATKDINSQVLDAVNSYQAMYRVPYEKLRERNYLHKDNIIIKLTIYLNS